MKRRELLKSAGVLGGLTTAASVSAPFAAVAATSRHHRQNQTLSVVTWNVACGQWCTPEQAAEAMTSGFQEGQMPDLVLLNEVPKFNPGDDAADWSGRIAEKLELPFFYVGSISSAHHRAPEWGDITGHYGGKFKSIMSRWPLSNTHDYLLEGEGWSPASAVRAELKIGAARWAIYSLHVPGHRVYDRSKHRSLVSDVLANEPLEHVVVAGDFNVGTHSAVLKEVKQGARLDNAITDQSIDHILYRSSGPIRMIGSGLDNGPVVETRIKRLSDHPFAWVRFDLAG